MKIIQEIISFIVVPIGIGLWLYIFYMLYKYYKLIKQQNKEDNIPLEQKINTAIKTNIDLNIALIQLKNVLEKDYEIQSQIRKTYQNIMIAYIVFMFLTGVLSVLNYMFT